MAKKVVSGNQQTSKKKSSSQQKPPPVSPPGSQAGGRKNAKTPHARIADLYVNTYQRKTIFCRGKYFRYKDGLWSDVNMFVIRKEIAGSIEKVNAKNYRSADVDSVEKLVRSLLFKPDDLLDSMDGLINLKNGVYDVENQVLIAHNPNFYMTTQLPFDYDLHADYPIWKYYLKSSLVGWDETMSAYYQDPELVEFVQEAIGYSLTTDIQYHVMFWCLGKGRNGKGILFHILERLGGDSVTPLDVNLLKYNQYQLATLAGKKIALCSESNSTKNLVEDSIIKMLVAGDSMIVRQIRQEPFTLNPMVKLWWAMNQFPAVADTSDGFWRRILLIPFNRSFSPKEVDTKLKQKLEPELPGIFVWAMEGLRRLQQRGSFAIPKQVQDFIAEYKLEANTVASWIEAECDTTIATAKGRASILHNSYKMYCAQSGYSPYSLRKFSREMVNLGYAKKRDNGGMYYEGVNVLTPFQQTVP